MKQLIGFYLLLVSAGVDFSVHLNPNYVDEMVVECETVEELLRVNVRDGKFYAQYAIIVNWGDDDSSWTYREESITLNNSVTMIGSSDYAVINPGLHDIYFTEEGIIQEKY